MRADARIIAPDRDSHPAWSPAFRLALALLRQDGAAPALAAGVGAAAFTDALRRHRIALAMPQADRLTGQLPPPLVEALADRQRRMTLAAIARTGQLRALAQALGLAGIEVCAVKGPAFAALFGDPLRREGCDLDLLVRPADRDRALDRLEALGYRLDGVERPGLDRYGAANHALPLSRGADAPVELHLRLGDRAGQWPMARFDPWRHRTMVGIAGLPVPTLMPEAALVYAVFHGTKHNWHRLFWLADIARAMGAPVDWSLVLAMARALGLERQLMMAALLAEAMLGARLPAALAREERLKRIAGPLAAGLAPHLDDLPSDRGAALAARLGMRRYLGRLLALHSGWRARLGLVRQLLGTTGEDRRFVPLPAWLGPAYPAVRLYRLMSRHRARRTP